VNATCGLLPPLFALEAGEDFGIAHVHPTSFQLQSSQPMSRCRQRVNGVNMRAAVCGLKLSMALICSARNS